MVRVDERYTREVGTKYKLQMLIYKELMNCLRSEVCSQLKMELQ